MTSPFPLWDQPIVRDLDYRGTKEFACEAMHAAALWSLDGGDLRTITMKLRKAARKHGVWGQQAEWIIGYAFAEYGVHYGDIRP